MPITQQGFVDKMPAETPLADKTKPMPQHDGPDPSKTRISNWNQQRPGVKRGKPQCDCGAYKTK